MARPLRLEFAGAVYHVTSRGDRRDDIYVDTDDRQAWLEVLTLVCERFNWVVHAYCQMTNHYHLLLETTSVIAAKVKKKSRSRPLLRAWLLLAAAAT